MKFGCWTERHGFMRARAGLAPEGADPRGESAVAVNAAHVGDGFFRTLGMAIVEGHDFRKDELFGGGDAG